MDYSYLSYINGTSSNRYIRSWRRLPPQTQQVLQSLQQAQSQSGSQQSQGGVGVQPQQYVHGDLDGGSLCEGVGSSPGTPGGKLADLLQLASPEDHERILRAAAMLSPESPRS